MSRQTRRWPLLLVCTLLIAALAYWSSQPQTILQESGLAQPSYHPDIDFYALNSHTVKYLSNGQRHYELTANKVEHLKSTDVSLLTQPDLHVYRTPDGKESPWHARSERGEVSSEATSVELIDKVRVERADAEGRPLILTTTRLTIEPDKNYAQTAQPVRIEAFEGVTTATGMKAFMDKSQMHLLSNVRGLHEIR